MTKKILFIVLLASIQLMYSAAAQDFKQPVQFVFSATKLTDTSATLTVHAVAAKGTRIFTAVKKNNDDVFVSSLQLDSSAFVHGAVKEEGVAGAVAVPGSTYKGTAYDSVTFTYTIGIKTGATAVKGSFSWLAVSGDDFPSGEEKINVIIKGASAAATNAADAAASENTEGSMWSIFLLCLATGLLAVITPCVFPLIPVTVSFFLKRSKTRIEGLKNAVWYSISIILIYTIPTLLLTLIFGDKILYTISTHPVSNIFFFVVFIVFAISFFGAFELALPNSWANKADQKAGKGGLLGIFFMALTLVIVSFSCTGPIVGTLLGQTSMQGVGLAPIIGMMGFGVGLAIPFSLFAFFPSMLQSLPKSGGWLNTIKVSFGFIELALALKFLSNVDLSYHLGILNRDVFLVLWIVVFFLLGVYLLGKLKFAHDSDLPFVSVPRLFFAIASFSFTVYMVPGLWGAPLKALSGFIPPSTTQEFNLNDLQYKIGNAAGISPSAGPQAAPPKKYTNKLHVPFGLTAYFDLEEGMAAAKILKKPIMLDFTGHTCPNCRKMEEQVWKDPAVLSRIKENFILVSLYVDETEELPINEQYTDKNGVKIETVGGKNLDYEIKTFGFNAQPLYMFLDLNGKPLSDVKYGYDPSVAGFIKHLDAVKAAFDAANK
ncbi:MAG: protein-disulfide reductase DsbD family protein [Bacteroidota bacterium]|jgi:thiol:disulfide interchange protein